MTETRTPEQIAEQIDGKIQLAISAVRCDSSIPTGSWKDSILSALRDVEARALREAADRIEHTSRPLVTQESVVEWLRARADALTPRSGEDQTT